MNKRTTRNSSTGVTGVLLNSTTRKWHASIKINGIALFLGSFETKEHAMIARTAANRVREEIFSQQRANDNARKSEAA